MSVLICAYLLPNIELLEVYCWIYRGSLTSYAGMRTGTGVSRGSNLLNCYPPLLWRPGSRFGKPPIVGCDNFAYHLQKALDFPTIVTIY